VKTDGAPLFVEEVTKTVIESIGSVGSIRSVGSGESVGAYGRTPLQLAIPATLQELNLQSILGTSLVATKGYTALEVEEAYTKALVLRPSVFEGLSF